MNNIEVPVKVHIIFILVFLLIVVSILALAHFILPGLLISTKGKAFNDELQTKNFVFYYNTSAKYVEELSTSCEKFLQTFYYLYEKRFDLKKIDRKIFIYLLGNKDELNKIAQKRFATDMVNNSGFYDSTESAIAILLSNKKEIDKTVLFHEIVHMIFDLAIGTVESKWSSWFSEGSAMYFSKFDESERKIGWVEKNKNNYLPLKSILEANPQSFTSEENYKYYFASENLINFLIKNGYYDNWLKMEKAPDKCYYDDVILQNYNINKSLKSLEEEFERYLKK